MDFFEQCRFEGETRDVKCDEKSMRKKHINYNMFIEDLSK